MRPLLSHARPDDFVVEEYGFKARGARFDRDLEHLRQVWQGAYVGGGKNPAVPEGTRQVPMLFGGFAAAALARMAKWGQGYTGGSRPAPMVAPSFDAARAAGRLAGREGEPRLVALAYYALSDGERGRQNVFDYYSGIPDFAKVVADAVCVTPQDVKDTVAAFAEIGATDVIFDPGTDDVDDVERLAEIVL